MSDEELIEEVALAICKCEEGYTERVVNHPEDSFFFRDAAKAAIEVINSRFQQSGWRPIAEAPKDGTMVDLWVSHPDLKGARVTDCHFSRGKWRHGNFEVEGMVSISTGEALIKATYFQHLPTPRRG